MVAKFYDGRAWRALRAAKLASQPLCEYCQLAGITRAASVADHIVSINRGGDALPSLDGLASLCPPCHNSKTARLDKHSSAIIERHTIGFDVDGNPLCRVDDWQNQGGGSIYRCVIKHLDRTHLEQNILLKNRNLKPLKTP